MRLPVTALASTVLVVGLLAGCAEAPVEDDEATIDDISPDQPDEARLLSAESGVYVGLSEQDALELAAENKVTARVGTREDVGEIGTDGYDLDRHTFVVEDGIVIEVIVETDQGPISIADF